MAALDEQIFQYRVVICAGSGGVGKTTTAASLAVHAALSGYRTVVLTIDPAKRLANALGLERFTHTDTPVTVDGIPEGMLSAMMLDQKGAWDALVEKHAPSPDVKERILANHFYQHLSQAFAGSQEYMAVEQLSELYASGRYDLIVVDTPPTRHALDFLEAPQRLANFLDGQILKWFVRPYFSAGWSTMQWANRTMGYVFRKLEDATGVSALVEVSEFFTSMSSLFEGLEQRVRRVYELLRSDETAFVLVATPEEHVLREVAFFADKVHELGMRLRGVVFNRVHRAMAEEGAVLSGPKLHALVQDVAPSARAAQRLVENFNQYETRGRGDSQRIQDFQRELPATVAVVEIPNFESDVHNLAGLQAMHPYFTGEAGQGG